MTGKQQELFSENEVPHKEPKEDPHFDGSDYVKELDQIRLTGQIKRVYSLMQDQKWRTLDLISAQTGDPHASISAQLRHLRKKRFGEHTVNKRRAGDETSGLFEYQLIPNPDCPKLILN